MCIPICWILYFRSAINSPGELFCQHHLLRGQLFKGGVIQERSSFFNVIFSLWQNKNSSQTAAHAKLFRSKNETKSVHDDLLVGSYSREGVIFRCWRWEGDLFKEIRYATLLLTPNSDVDCAFLLQLNRIASVNCNSIVSLLLIS